MSIKKNHPNKKELGRCGPVIPGSVLYRMLQQLAQAVAMKLNPRLKSKLADHRPDERDYE